MTRITEERREQRRRQILDAAQRCFLRDGYQKTSMNQVVRESGLSTGAVYGYFSGKRELVQAVAQRVTGPHLTPAGGSTAAPRTPAALARELLTSIEDGAPLAAVVQVWGEASTDEDFHAMVADSLRAARRSVADEVSRCHLAPGDTEERSRWAADQAAAVLGVVLGWTVQRTFLGDLPVARYVAASGLADDQTAHPLS